MDMTRRDFVKGAAALGASAVLGGSLTGCDDSKRQICVALGEYDENTYVAKIFDDSNKPNQNDANCENYYKRNFKGHMYIEAEKKDDEEFEQTFASTIKELEELFNQSNNEHDLSKAVLKCEEGFELVIYDGVYENTNNITFTLQGLDVKTADKKVEGIYIPGNVAVYFDPYTACRYGAEDMTEVIINGSNSKTK